MDRQIDLSDVLTEFARTLITDYPIQGILDHLVVRIADVLPISAAGVMVVGPDTGNYLAASTGSALRFEQLQLELDEGPCLEAASTGEVVSVTDLVTDDRYPSFAAAATAGGLVSAWALPLCHDGTPIGALDLYCEAPRLPGPLADEVLAAARTLADVAAVYVLNAQARSELRDSSDRFREIALHDPLTGLPNRVHLRQRLDHAVQRARRSHRMTAILFIDLDRFKTVNDTHGHQTGDELLVAVAERLNRLLRPGDTLARVYGDEFVVLCEDLDEASQVDALASRIGSALDAPFVLATTQLQVTASVGMAFAGRGELSAEQVLQDADAAMYQAKRKGGARHQIIDLRERHQADRRAALRLDVREASARGELRTHYQPVVDTADGSLTGAEALLRWAHPSRGLVAPETAVPLAEQAGVITEIGRWILERACQDRHRWQRTHGVGHLQIEVNVSAQQLMSADFVTAVADVLLDTHTEAGALTLELTESVFVHDSQRALVVLRRLKDLGVGLALDDFGTGYSSLSYLKRFPVDVVKIDRTFVADLGRDAASSAIVAAIVDLAHALGMAVVAEGVENADQHAAVAALGCERSQGFYFGRPVSSDALSAQLRARSDGGPLRLPSLDRVGGAAGPV